MRWRPLIYSFLGLLCLSVVLWCWVGGKPQSAPTNAPSADSAREPSHPVRLLSEAAAAKTAGSPGRLNLRLSNTAEPVDRLVRNEAAILLENAFLDTSLPGAISIPEHLRSHGDPGAYIVQSRSAPDAGFRAAIQAAGAQIVGYIPNNAYLVRASTEMARALAGQSLIRSVTAYEPYFKLKRGVLKLAVQGEALPENSELNLLLFPGSREAARLELEKLGVTVLGDDVSPFGPVVRVRVAGGELPALAGLAEVQEVEMATARRSANDLSRPTLSVATNSTDAPNYLGLTGNKVMVNVNDTGVSTNHPDLAGRVYLDPLDLLGLGGYDTAGHGTHVAGIIAGDGSQSASVGTNASGSVGPAVTGQFRGKAPGASIYSMHVMRTDRDLQESVGRTNILISNNSWNYGNADYDLAAASYDAAVRDALPLTPGSRQVLYVFPGGNGGRLNKYIGNGDTGFDGSADTILSPATAKNVITVGAVEQYRNISNEVSKCTTLAGNTDCTTNQYWFLMTDSSNQVAGFSSCGNVGIGVEGEAGRFKPDVVAPGSFVISTKSSEWDQPDYYNPTSYINQAFSDVIIAPGSMFLDSIYIPLNAVWARIVVSPFDATKGPALSPIYLRQAGSPTTTTYDFLGTNVIMMPPDFALVPGNSSIYYGVGNATTNVVAVNISYQIAVTNELGNFFEVLSNMNQSLGPYYRYESGSSMAAAAVSGTLALMQEFFEQRLGRTNSPALMKALLINGARSLGIPYDFQVHGTNAVNRQGWGMVNLTNSIRAVMSTNGAGGASSIFVFDQSPAEALATGQSRTRNFSVSPVGRILPLQVTLAWTDPPGNPVAGVKLVNDLDLVVTDLNSGAVFYGNDITSGQTANSAWNTNYPPNSDVINNVESVLLSPNLGSNYSITVVGRRVNVNAVSDHPNDVVQDYALVVSSGNGRFANTLTLTADNPTVSVTQSLVSSITNSFQSSADHYGGILSYQHVGASTPLLGTNLVPLPNTANGQLTVGMTNQWHFYVITNVLGYTNAAFLTFLPPNLSLPRMGVFETGNVDNSSRPQADVDLYVSTDPALLNLDPNAVNLALKSLSRGGTETIILSNAINTTYYIGVKAEDQRAAEYSLLVDFSRLPFGNEDQYGNQTLFGFPIPQDIPDGTAARPGEVSITAICPIPIQLRRVVVSNTITHELMGDLTGILTHDSDDTRVILNNKSPDSGVTNVTYIYDDSDDGDIPGAGHTAGPGSLHDFAGKQSGVQWRLSMYDDSPAHTGSEDALVIWLEKQQPLTNGIIVTLAPGRCKEEFVDVPANAVGMTITAAFQAGTGPLGLDVCRLNDATSCVTNVITAPGGEVTIDTSDTPPLSAGTYVVRLCNLGSDMLTVRVKATFQYSEAQPVAQSFISTTTTPIQDDSITYSSMFVGEHLTVSKLDVGMLINHERISDLAITLISPKGTRVLLFESRGAASTNGLGTFGGVTNAAGLAGFSYAQMTPFYTNGFDHATAGPYAPGAIFEGWTPLSGIATVYPEYAAPWLSNNILVLGDGVISNTLPTTNSTTFRLTYLASHAPYLVGTIGWWPLDEDGRDIFGGLDGLLCGNVHFSTGMVSRAFLGDGTATRMTVPGCPAIDVGQRGGFSVEGWINPGTSIKGTNQGPVSTSVPGSSPWTDTGVDVVAGQRLIITASGNVRYGGGVGWYTDPNGVGPVLGGTNKIPGNPYPDTIVLSLIGKTGGSTAPGTGTPVPEGGLGKGPGFVGSSYSQIIQTSGRLYLGYNDSYFGDNGGSYSVTISVETPLDPAPLVEWTGSTISNTPVPGVQFWLSGLPGTNIGSGALCANLWDTNGFPHLVCTTTNAITNGGWQHVAMSYDATTATARIYTNGHIAASQQVGTTNIFPNTGGNLHLGYHPAPGANFRSFLGGLDEFGLYERALSDCEVAGIYNAGPGGKYSSNVLSCPITNTVQLVTSGGTLTFAFTNGLAWATNGPQWETNIIDFTLGALSTNSLASNATPLMVSSSDPNLALDHFVLSGILTNFIDGLLHFSEDTNVALVPIKFAPAPYSVSNFPPVLVYSNDFEMATQSVYLAGAVLPGITNDPAMGPRDWTVTAGPLTVLSNSLVDDLGTNSAVMAYGALETLLPTIPGHRYQLEYSVRGPGAVGWWNGNVEPLSRRAWDLISGNHGAYMERAASSGVAYVGDQALFFPGRNTNGLASKIELGDPADLRLTNSLTIEGWIRPEAHTNDVGGTEQLVFRGDTRDCFDPYFLALEPTADGQRTLRFHVADATSLPCGIELYSSNGAVRVGEWQHIVAVFEFDASSTNFAGLTNQLRLYVNGVLVASTNTSIAPFRDLEDSYRPGITLGNRSRYDYSEPYYGYMDEVSMYGRSLTEPEIGAIFAAGRTGKADLTVAPAVSLAGLVLSLNGVQTDLAHGYNSKWTARSVVFTASQSNTVAAFQSFLPGTILGGISLLEIPPELYYQPETSLKAFEGEDAYGEWRLEFWDTRTGATNGLAALLNWEMDFIFNPVIPQPVITLQHGVPYTNSLSAHTVQNFIVEVPQWAVYATNDLLFASARIGGAPLGVGVLFDTNGFPLTTSNAVFWPPVATGVAALASNTVPAIQSGYNYYLTVTNPNDVSVTFAYEVLFDIMTLTNCHPMSNFVWQAGIPRYLQFDVPTNSVPPIESTFRLTGAQTNLTVVLSQHLPLPTLTDYDYISRQPCTNDEAFFVLTNTTPFPIQSGRWYVGIFNSSAAPVPFLAQACYTSDTNLPVIISLTNEAPFAVASFLEPLAAPPGPPQWTFFKFQITNFVDGVLFELYNLSGDADLVLERDVPPGMAPYFDGSFRIGTHAEQIVLRTGSELADLRGDWYLGVYNNESTNVAYTIRAALASGGMLRSGNPLQQTLTFLTPPRGLLIQWNAIVGERYVVETKAGLDPATPWNDISGIVVATTPCATFEVVPVPAGGFRFYRVRQISAFAAPMPSLRIQLWTGNTVRISWPAGYATSTLQYRTSLAPGSAWSNVSVPVVIEGTEAVVYDAIGTEPRYYRLVP